MPQRANSLRGHVPQKGTTHMRNATPPSAAGSTGWLRGLPAVVGALVLTLGLVLLAPHGEAGDDAPARDASPTKEAAERQTPTHSVRGLAAKIDAVITNKLDGFDMKPAPRCDDATFLRRVYLDVLGTVPTPRAVEEFQDSRDPNKRRIIIDHLVRHDSAADYWGMWWYRTLTGMSVHTRPSRDGGGGRALAGIGGKKFYAWLSQQMKDNRPYNEIVHDLLTATGRTDENGAAAYFARWDGNANNAIGAASKHFLGIQIQCAQCHDHMYEETWKQSDFRGMAAFFATTTQRRAAEYRELRELRRKLNTQRLAKKGGSNEIARPGKASPGMDGDGMDSEGMDGPSEMDGPRKGNRGQFTPEDRKRMMELRKYGNVYEVVDIPVRNAQTAKRLARRLKNRKLSEEQRKRIELRFATPKLWHGAEVPDMPGISRRLVLARWITSDDNPYFGKALVNRLWGAFLGTGIVDPVDDFNSFNPPSHPEILDMLSKDFVASGYDLKRVMCIILNTEAYQRTSTWSGEEAPESSLFAVARVRPLTTDQLSFALIRAMGLERRFGRQTRNAGNRLRATFSKLFSFVFDDDEAKESEDFEGSIAQGLFMMNSPILERTISGRRGMPLGRLMTTHTTDAARVKQLYLGAFGRYPTAKESSRAVEFVQSANTPEEGYEDLLWALVNAAEFMTNH